MLNSKLLKNGLEKDGTSFATCFICGEKGHLSSKCPHSTHGLYPNGGCCRTCGSVEHLVRDCPEKKKKQVNPDALEEDYSIIEEKEEKPKVPVTEQFKKPKVVNFKKK